MNRILLTGKSGQVGWELQRTLATLGHVIAVNRQAMDLANSDSIRRVVREVKPHLIVNAAAYTAVDRAEKESELAMAINGNAPGVLAEEAKRFGAAIVHYSTDYVFDGTKDSPYVEEDAPNPINEYGRSKLAGERAIQAVGAPHLIFRTSWVYGARGHNFLMTILRLAKEKQELKIVNDQIGAPTWSRMIAEATAQVLAQCVTSAILASTRITDVSGIYHLTQGGQTSWFGFAKHALTHASLSTLGALPNLASISSSEYPSLAKRPKNSVIQNDKSSRTFGLALPSWENALELCLYSESVRNLAE